MNYCKYTKLCAFFLIFSVMSVDAMYRLGASKVIPAIMNRGAVNCVVQQKFSTNSGQSDCQRARFKKDLTKLIVETRAKHTIIDRSFDNRVCYGHISEETFNNVVDEINILLQSRPSGCLFKGDGFSLSANRSNVKTVTCYPDKDPEGSLIEKQNFALERDIKCLIRNTRSRKRGFTQSFADTDKYGIVTQDRAMNSSHKMMQACAPRSGSSGKDIPMVYSLIWHSINTPLTSAPYIKSSSYKF